MTFVSYVVPPILGYFVVAVLAVIPRTHAVRIALWPVIALLALRAAVSVDMPPSEPDQKSNNTSLIFSMLFIVSRTFDWTLAKEPLARRHHPAEASKSILLDVLDLISTLRGHGWDWSRGVHIPRETRPTNRRAFILHVTLSAVFHFLIYGLLVSAIRSFSPMGFGCLSGGSIFDRTLAPYVRYPRASLISVLAAFAVYAVLQAGYGACTTIAVLVFGQDPAQWPPAFDAPWCATSLSDFWGRRWHQFHRPMLVQGGRAFSFFLGRAGFVLGTFLFSGALHHVAMVSLQDQLEPWRMLVGFGMMAPGVLAERAFKRATGKKVDGLVGWMWTMIWLLLWGNVIFDGTARAGVFWWFDFIGDVLPGRAVVERLVVNFDMWLHAI